MKDTIPQQQFNPSRMRAIREAVQDEQTRFNAAVKNGKRAILCTAFGPYEIEYVDTDFWYHTKGIWPCVRSFAGCNDEYWADLMAQVGEPRNPKFSRGTV